MTMAAEWCCNRLNEQSKTMRCPIESTNDSSAFASNILWLQLSSHHWSKALSATRHRPNSHSSSERGLGVWGASCMCWSSESCHFASDVFSSFSPCQSSWLLSPSNSSRHVHPTNPYSTEWTKSQPEAQRQRWLHLATAYGMTAWLLEWRQSHGYITTKLRELNHSKTWLSECLQSQPTLDSLFNWDTPQFWIETIYAPTRQVMLNHDTQARQFMHQHNK